MTSNHGVGDPVHVVAGDYDYYGRIAAVFPKLKSGAVRYVVEDDRGRLFIHGPAQIHAALSTPSADVVVMPTSPSPTEGILKPPFERYGEADIADQNGHVCTADNRDIADALMRALSTTDTVAVPRATLKRLYEELATGYRRPLVDIAAEIDRILQGGADA